MNKKSRLTELLQEGDGTLTEWRENEPEAAAEAEALAETLGFDIPYSDDYVWQAAEAWQQQQC